MQESLSLALGLGFLLGLKHATEADHLMAVTTIVSQHRSVWRSALVGALWGVGHSASLLMAGCVVILFRVAIPERLATILELAVAVMIIVLGSRVLYFVLREQTTVHTHSHKHQGHHHAHLHFHESADAHVVEPVAPINGKESVTHQADHRLADHRLAIGWRPVLVGVVHGLAGSAALTLLVLTEVMRGGSAISGMLYLLLFGLGSIGGMLLMSALVSLPFVFAAQRLAPLHRTVQLIAGVTSVLFGVYYAWEIWQAA